MLEKYRWRNRHCNVYSVAPICTSILSSATLKYAEFPRGAANLLPAGTYASQHVSRWAETQSKQEVHELSQ
jgi:hypothetical protein